MKRLISNVGYVMKYACKYDRKMAAAYIASACADNAACTIINTFLLKEIIDILMAGADILSIIMVLVVIALVNAVGLAVYVGLENYYNVKLVKVSGAIQRELMEKARMMNLKYYDIPEYYDDFVIAASQSEDMVTMAISSIGQISASLLFDNDMRRFTMLEQAKNTCEQVFGKRLRELRKENGYTIEQFADMVGISKTHSVITRTTSECPILRYSQELPMC